MSTSFAATLFDGRRSGGIAATVTMQGNGNLVVETVHGRQIYAVHALRISSRLGNSTRYLTLPDGGKLQTADNDAVDSIQSTVPELARSGLLHAVETRWSWVLMSVVLTVVFLWWSIFIGLPWLANRTAHAIPVALEASMGEQTLALLDRHMLRPTRLMEVERERVRVLFDRLVGAARFDTPATLELRRAEQLGANAFALPSGIIVVTDELVRLAREDHELLAVLAHEAGHVKHRHIMRSILQNSAVALVLATLLGDINSISALAASIPTLLVEQGYSREFEFEADRYAMALLDREGIERSYLSSILKRLQESHGMQEHSDYLSTHPSVSRRIQAIEGAEGTE